MAFNIDGSLLVTTGGGIITWSTIDGSSKMILNQGYYKHSS